jgi:hypothetical protein
MTLLTPQLILLAAVTTAVGAAMIRLGVAHGLLQLRKGEHRCPACGRSTRGGVCPRCSGSDGPLRGAPYRANRSRRR